MNSLDTYVQQLDDTPEEIEIPIHRFNIEDKSSGTFPSFTPAEPETLLYLQTGDSQHRFFAVHSRTQTELGSIELPADFWVTGVAWEGDELYVGAYKFMDDHSLIQRVSDAKKVLAIANPKEREFGVTHELTSHIVTHQGVLHHTLYRYNLGSPTSQAQLEVVRTLSSDIVYQTRPGFQKEMFAKLQTVQGALFIDQSSGVLGHQLQDIANDKCLSVRSGLQDRIAHISSDGHAVHVADYTPSGLIGNKDPDHKALFYSSLNGKPVKVWNTPEGIKYDNGTLIMKSRPASLECESEKSGYGLGFKGFAVVPTRVVENTFNVLQADYTREESTGARRFLPFLK